jgi:hypothetical protein
MKNDRRAPPPRPVVIEDGTSFNASTDWFMAGLMFAAAVAAFFFFRVPQNFDFNSRDFNPFVLLPPFLALIGVRPLYRAIRDTLVGRKFGKTVFEMESESVELGDTLRGKICCSRALQPTGDYEVSLQCVEAITRTSTNMKEVTDDHIRWEALRKVDPRTVDAMQGIPVEFTPPTTALGMGGDPRAQGAVRWVLDVKAPHPGGDFRAIFALVVRPRKA